MIPGTAPTVRIRATDPDGAEAQRSLPEETPVALVYNGGTQAVMMATPADIVDFALGFTLTEGIAPPDALPEVEVVAHEAGIEARMWLPAEAEARLLARRRASVGPVGCGLCGIDSLAQALRPLPRLAPGGLTLSPSDVKFALAELRDWQPLHDETRAVHAAGFWRPGDGILMAREDVGRHNALDKLVGALARAGVDPASGAIALTSRVSVEMVQKAVMAGSPILVAVSAPTAQAVRVAEEAGLTVASTARGEVHVFTHGGRIARPPQPPETAPMAGDPMSSAETPALDAHAAEGAAKLVRMANQIATFFATQPGTAQAAEVAGHLKAFWEPRMLAALLAHLDAGGDGLSPLAREAAGRLRA